MSERGGSRENNGCPDKDGDGDGVVDRVDKCPDKAGPAERDGCPEEDADADGIPDSKDKCPDAAEDKDRFEDDDGCPDPDNDKDGVVDEKDKCPTEAETKNRFQDDDGCPDEVPAQVKKFTGVIKGINFRRNSADIKASSFPLLKQSVTVFKEFPDLRIEILGHTSNEGRREFNMKLSRKRAESVKQFLSSAGIDEGRIGTVGTGPTAQSPTTRARKVKRRTGASSSGCCSTGEKVKSSPSRRTSTLARAQQAEGEGQERQAQGRQAQGREDRKAGRQTQGRQDRRPARRRSGSRETRAQGQAEGQVRRRRRTAQRVVVVGGASKARAPHPSLSPLRGERVTAWSDAPMDTTSPLFLPR